MPRIHSWICVFILQTLAATTAARAADVLNEVPRDALGFAVIRQLDGVEGKAEKVLEALGSAPAGPLALLKSIAGIEAGLDAERDLLMVLLPPENNSRQFHLAVWLPAKDYTALVESLEGDPQRQVAAVTIAGEDLLVVKHDEWAVVMDPDQRDRIERLRAGESSNATIAPRQLAMWSYWISQNDAAVVVLPAGMRTLWSLAASEQLFTPPTPRLAGDGEGNDLFGPPQARRRAETGWPAARTWIRNTFGDAPEVARWAAEAQGAAVGVKLDEAGNAVVGVRLAFAEDAIARAGEADSKAKNLPPQLFEGGEFVVAGSGQVSPRWLVPAVAPYVRQVTNDVAAQFGHKPDAADVAKFRQAVEQAAAEVRGYSLVFAEGSNAATYTNHFLALSVASSSDFLQRSGSLMEMWNAMLGKTEGGKLLSFAARPVTISGRSGTEYSIDMMSVAGGPAIPEIKASMEKLFGPGGKFRLQFVPIDDSTVLLAAASEEQVGKVLDRIGKREVTGAAANTESVPQELKQSSELVADKREWQLFVSPHGYTEWMRRQMDAILGAVIGGPVVPDFAASPPVGFVGGVDGQIVWAEMAIPADTLRAAGKYLRR
jgi:hypothetical protein